MDLLNRDGRYYNRQVPGLGDAFVDEVEAGIGLLAASSRVEYRLVPILLKTSHGYFGGQLEAISVLILRPGIAVVSFAEN